MKLDLHHRHVRQITREEERSFPSRTRYFNTPHLICPHINASSPFAWDMGSAVAVGSETLPSWTGSYWVLPTGVWTARMHLEGAVSPPGSNGERARVRARLLADASPGADPAEHEFSTDIAATFDGQVVLAAYQIRAQVETAPLTSNGSLALWSDVVVTGAGAASLSSSTRIVFGRLA